LTKRKFVYNFTTKLQLEATRKFSGRWVDASIHSCGRRAEPPGVPGEDGAKENADVEYKYTLINTHMNSSVSATPMY
jgi:hypothetical protein